VADCTRIMGDKSPKDVQKKSSQKQAKTNSAKQHAAKNLVVNQAARPKK
jgi:hypothetical protein